MRLPHAVACAPYIEFGSRVRSHQRGNPIVINHYDINTIGRHTNTDHPHLIIRRLPPGNDDITFGLLWVFAYQYPA